MDTTVHSAFVHESTQVWLQMYDGEGFLYRECDSEAKAQACAESINEWFFPELRWVDAGDGQRVPLVVPVAVWEVQ